MENNDVNEHMMVVQNCGLVKDPNIFIFIHASAQMEKI